MLNMHNQRQFSTVTGNFKQALPDKHNKNLFEQIKFHTFGQILSEQIKTKIWKQHLENI